MRWGLSILGWATAAVLWATPAHAQPDMRELLTERALVHGANPAHVLAVASCETGRTFATNLVGKKGERGVGQWLPGRGNHWDFTPHWREERLDIVALYEAGDERAPWLDADALAWSLSPKAPPGNARGWPTCGAAI